MGGLKKPVGLLLGEEPLLYSSGSVHRGHISSEDIGGSRGPLIELSLPKDVCKFSPEGFSQTIFLFRERFFFLRSQ